VIGSEKEEARPPDQASPLPSFPRIQSDHLRVRKGQISGLLKLCALKKTNVAETSLVRASVGNPATKNLENCRFLIISTAARGAKSSYLMGFSLPHHGSPIGTRRGPVPPVGASSLFASTMPRAVGDRPTRGTPPPPKLSACGTSGRVQTPRSGQLLTQSRRTG
jgi:hypothetical protein